MSPPSSVILLACCSPTHPPTRISYHPLHPSTHVFSVHPSTHPPTHTSFVPPGIPVGTWNPQAKKLKEDLQGFHHSKFDPMLDERVLAVSRGEEVPDDLLSMMVKEKMTRAQM